MSEGALWFERRMLNTFGPSCWRRGETLCQTKKQYQKAKLAQIYKVGFLCREKVTTQNMGVGSRINDTKECDVGETTD